MIHSSLTHLENLLSELGAKDPLTQTGLSALVTLMVEHFFSLMRQDNPMPTQLKYGIRHGACVRELEMQIHHGHCHYFTSPDSYLDKLIDCHPPPKPPISVLEEYKLTLSEIRELRDCVVSFSKIVRQNAVRDKDKEDTGHFPYPVSFSLQNSEPDSNGPTSTLLEGLNGIYFCRLRLKIDDVITKLNLHQSAFCIDFFNAEIQIPET